MQRGIFITFEGPDGSGKSTQLMRLAAALGTQARPVVTVRQPGGTALGDRIRALLLDSGNDLAMGPVDPRAELGLMFADRAQAVAQIIQPALLSGSIVLCDRFTDSSEAYQGAGRELGTELVRALHRTLVGGLQPDLTLLLLPPLQVSLERARRRNQVALDRSGKDENRFERESDSFYRRVHAAYEAIAQREPDRVVPITEDASLDTIEAHIWTIVAARLQGLVSTA